MEELSEPELSLSCLFLEKLLLDLKELSPHVTCLFHYIHNVSGKVLGTVPLLHLTSLWLELPQIRDIVSVRLPFLLSNHFDLLIRRYLQLDYIRGLVLTRPKVAHSHV